MKLCSGCKTQKPATEFHANPRMKSGLQSRCKACAKAEYDRRRASNPERYREYARRSELKQSAKLKAKREAELGQAVRCEICGKQERILQWDHDHSTGNARGWLCRSCNTGLGKFGDNPVLLEQASKYLRSRVFTVTKPRLS